MIGWRWRQLLLERKNISCPTAAACCAVPFAVSSGAAGESACSCQDGACMHACMPVCIPRLRLRGLGLSPLGWAGLPACESRHVPRDWRSRAWMGDGQDCSQEATTLWSRHATDAHHCNHVNRESCGRSVSASQFTFAVAVLDRHRHSMEDPLGLCMLSASAKRKRPPSAWFGRRGSVGNFAHAGTRGRVPTERPASPVRSRLRPQPAAVNFQRRHLEYCAWWMSVSI